MMHPVRLFFFLCVSTAALAQTPSANFLVVPGQALGKIKLGITQKAVKGLLGNPQGIRSEDSATVLEYRSKSSGNQVLVYLLKDKVVQIGFTSASYQTKEGITTRNADSQKQYFTSWRLPMRFINLKHTYQKGGLTFYSLNVDSADPAYPVRYWGVVHPLDRLPYEILYDSSQANGGWLPWSGDDIYEP